MDTYRPYYLEDLTELNFTESDTVGLTVSHVPSVRCQRCDELRDQRSVYAPTTENTKGLDCNLAHIDEVGLIMLFVAKCRLIVPRSGTHFSHYRAVYFID